MHCPECAVIARKATRRKYDSSPKRREKSKVHCKLWRAKNPEKVKERRAKYYAEHGERERAMHLEYMVANRERELERNRLYYHAKKGDAKAKLELAKFTGRAKTCERMHLTALELPCGKRPECWTGKACPRTVELGLTRPRGRDAFDFGHLWTNGIII